MNERDKAVVGKFFFTTIGDRHFGRTFHRHFAFVGFKRVGRKSVNETAALERTLVEDVGVSVDRVYMNGLYPERFSGPELERLEAICVQANGGIRGAYRAALSESRRASSQHEQLARLAELVRAPLRTLPFIFEPEVGVEEIRELAGELSGEIS